MSATAAAALNINRFYGVPPPSSSPLDLLSRHVLPYPTVANLIGLRSLLQRDPPLDHVANFPGGGGGGGAAAAFFPFKVLPDSAAAAGDCCRDSGNASSPANLCIASGGQQTGLQLADAAWSPYGATVSYSAGGGGDPAAVHGVGVFQRLLALMSQRASAALDISETAQKRHAAHSLLDRPHPSINSYDLMSPTAHQAAQEELPDGPETGVSDQ